MVEVAVASAMAAVLLVLVGQLLVSLRQNARRTEDRLLMLESVDNALEQFTAAPWSSIDQQQIAALNLPETVRRRWPQAALTGEVKASTDPVEAKQVTLRLSLGEDTLAPPVSLTTWVYRAAQE